MKLSTAGRAGILITLLLAGCGGSDRTGPTDTPATTTTAAAPAPSTTGSGALQPPTTTSAAESSADVGPSADSPEPEPAPTSAVPAVAAPSVAATPPQPPSAPDGAPAASAPAPNAPVPVPAPNADIGSMSAADFPDPAEVEAQGLATNPLCEVLSVDEVTALAGGPVAPAVDAADGTACLWSGTAAGSTYLQLQMLGDTARYLQPAGAEAVAGIGDAAFVVRSEGGWTAQAQNPDGTFAVQIAGSTASRDAAVEGLRRLLERY